MRIECDREIPIPTRMAPGAMPMGAVIAFYKDGKMTFSACQYVDDPSLSQVFKGILKYLKTEGNLSGQLVDIETKDD